VTKEIQETFGRVAYTHKTHEKQAEICEKQARRLKNWNVFFLSVTVIAAFVAPLVDSVQAAWTAAVAGASGLAFAIYQLSFDPAAAAAGHRETAKAYLALRDDYRRLLADVQAGASTAEVARRRDGLARQLEQLNRLSPQTSPKAYEQARAALQGTEELRFSDKEMRHLLGGPDDPQGA